MRKRLPIVAGLSAAFMALNGGVAQATQTPIGWSPLSSYLVNGLYPSSWGNCTPVSGQFSAPNGNSVYAQGCVNHAAGSEWVQPVFIVTNTSPGNTVHTMYMETQTYNITASETAPASTRTCTPGAYTGQYVCFGASIHIGTHTPFYQAIGYFKIDGVFVGNVGSKQFTL